MHHQPHNPKTPTTSPYRRSIPRMGVCAIAIVFAVAPNAFAQQPVQTMRLQRAAILDPMVNNHESLSFLLPADWKLEGQVQWLFEHSVLTNHVWRITHAPSRLMIQSLPYRHFTWSGDTSLIPEWGNHLGQTVLRPIRDPHAFVQAFWMPQTMPYLQNARLTHKAELPALAAQALREWGNARAEVKAWRLRYSYQWQGQPFEQDVVFVLLFTDWSPQFWQVAHCYTVSAPAGTLDRVQGSINTVLASISVNPHWQASWQVVKQLQRQGIQQGMERTRAFGRALTEHREQIAQIQKQLEADREASNRARQQTIREALGGIETYAHTQAATRVELPQGYRSAWVNQQGEFIVSTEPGFDPNPGQTQTWTKLEKIDPMATRSGR